MSFFKQMPHIRTVMLLFYRVVPFDALSQARSLFHSQIVMKHSVSKSTNITVVNGSLLQQNKEIEITRHVVLVLCKRVYE